MISLLPDQMQTEAGLYESEAWLISGQWFSARNRDGGKNWVFNFHKTPGCTYKQVIPNNTGIICWYRESLSKVKYQRWYTENLSTSGDMLNLERSFVNYF